MSLQRQAIKGTRWITASTVVNMTVRLLQVSILAHFFLEKDDFGLVAIALLVISFTEIFLDMGLSAAVLNKQNITKNEYSSLFWLNITSGIIIFVLVYLFTPLISGYYDIDELSRIIPLLSLTIIFSSTSRLQRTIQQKELRFKFIAIVDMCSSAIILISSLILAFLGFGVYSLVYSTILGSLFISIVYFVLFALYERNLKWHFKLKEISSFLKIGVFQLGSSLLDFFSREMDIMIISASFSLETLGAYSLCKQLVLRGYGLVTTIISKVLTPVLSKIQNNVNLLKDKYMSFIRTFSFIIFPIFFLIAGLSSSFLTVLYGRDYQEYWLILCILSVAYGIRIIGSPIGSLQIALGRTDVGFYWTICRVLLTAVIMGTGTMFSFPVFMSFILLNDLISVPLAFHINIKKLLNIKFKNYIFAQIKPFGVSAVILIIYICIGLSSHYYGLLVALCAAVVFMVVYILLSFVINRQQVYQLAGFVKTTKK